MIHALIVIALLGLIAWALTTYVPMPDGIKKVIVVGAVIFAILYMLQMLGLFSSLP